MEFGDLSLQLQTSVGFNDSIFIFFKPPRVIFLRLAWFKWKQFSAQDRSYIFELLCLKRQQWISKLQYIYEVALRLKTERNLLEVLGFGATRVLWKNQVCLPEKWAFLDLHSQKKLKNCHTKIWGKKSFVHVITGLRRRGRSLFIRYMPVLWIFVVNTRPSDLDQLRMIVIDKRIPFLSGSVGDVTSVVLQWQRRLVRFSLIVN